MFLRVICILALTCGPVFSATITGNGALNTSRSTASLAETGGGFQYNFGGTASFSGYMASDPGLGVILLGNSAAGNPNFTVSAVLSGESTASGVINGFVYGTLGLQAPALNKFTTILFASDPLTITGPGSYSVPFTLTGTLFGWDAASNSAVLDTAVWGRGRLSFDLNAGPSGLQTRSISYVVDVPEKETAWRVGTGILLLLVARRRQSR